MMKFPSVLPQVAIDAVEPVEPAEPARELSRHEPRSVYDLLHKPQDQVQLSELAESFKLAQAALVAALDASVHDSFDSVGVHLKDSIGLDYSPQSIAADVANFAALSLAVYRESEPDQFALIDVERLFRGGVESGYAEAMRWIEGQRMPGEVTSLARETKVLIDEELSSYFGRLRGTRRRH